MQREQAREQFDPYVDDDLAPPERLAFEALLARDAELRREFDAYRGTVSLLQGLPTQRAPDHFEALVKMRLRRRSRGRPFRERFRHSLVVESACCVLIVAIIATVTVFTDPAPDRPVAQAVDGASLEDRDRALLEEFGQIERVGTSSYGPELVAYLIVEPAREPALRDALHRNGRLHLLPLSPQHVGDKLRVRIQAPPRRAE